MIEETTGSEHLNSTALTDGDDVLPPEYEAVVTRANQAAARAVERKHEYQKGRTYTIGPGTVIYDAQHGEVTLQSPLIGKLSSVGYDSYLFETDFNQRPVVDTKEHGNIKVISFSIRRSVYDLLDDEEEQAYGAAKNLRTGGSIWLRLSGSDRREMRDDFRRTAGYGARAVIYDSDESPRPRPTKEQLMEQLQSLSENELVIALGSNPYTTENELKALVLRNASDVDLFVSTIFPKVVLRVKFSAANRFIAHDDILSKREGIDEANPSRDRDQLPDNKMKLDEKPEVEFDPSQLTHAELAIKNEYLGVGTRLARDKTLASSEVVNLVNEYISLGIRFYELLLAYPNLNKNYASGLRSSLDDLKTFVGKPRELCLSISKRDLIGLKDRWVWLADQCEVDASDDEEKKSTEEQEADFLQRKERARDLLRAAAGDISISAGKQRVPVSNTGLSGGDHSYQVEVNRIANARVYREAGAEAGMIYGLIRGLDAQRNTTELWQWLKQSLSVHLMVKNEQYQSCFKPIEDGGGIDWGKVYQVFDKSTVVPERSRASFRGALHGLRSVYYCFWR